MPAARPTELQELRVDGTQRKRALVESLVEAIGSGTVWRPNCATTRFCGTWVTYKWKRRRRGLTIEDRLPKKKSSGRSDTFLVMALLKELRPGITAQAINRAAPTALKINQTEPRPRRLTQSPWRFGEPPLPRARLTIGHWKLAILRHILRSRRATTKGPSRNNIGEVAEWLKAALC